MSAITAANLTVVKDKTTVLDTLSFTIPVGDVIGLIGPSGSGKTTLMRTLVGVQRYQGEVAVLGQRAGDRRLRSKIGYVTQSPAVYADLTVWQNIRYFATIVRASVAQVETVIQTVDLGQQASQLVGSLSGGQRARVSLAIALLGDPELLVLDEPTVGLDPILRNSLWGLFEQLAGEGKTLLVSSHVMDEAQRCQQLLMLRDGALLWHGQTRALLEQTHTKQVNDAFIKMVEQRR